ncbi:MAG: nucleotidyltransferase family protein [Nitrospinae bacterium]|nr:nucleotidyltransferase family protein [Nitrospinota bacterium]
MNSKPTPKKFDAILVAGEGESSYKVYHRHKAFLKLEGKCIVNYVVETLQQVESIKDIYIVGLKDRLQQTLKEANIDLNYPKRIFVVQQRDNLYENIWRTFLKTLPNEGNPPDLANSEHKDTAVLIVPCDAPLIAPDEVDYFIANCDLENYDHVLGLVSERNLEYFYPRDNRPGIKMAYLHLKEKSCRINNLHLVKPLRILNREYIRDMYQYRYQRNIKNVILFGLKLIGKDRLERFKYYLGLEACLLFASLGMRPMVDYFRDWTPKREFEQCISRIMKTRFVGLETPFPGAALDIDNDRDYETIKVRFKEWREYLARLDRSVPLPIRSESAAYNKA